MQSIKITNLEDLINNFDIDNAVGFNPFCLKCLLNNNIKCRKFYQTIKDEKQGGAFLCPFGFVCYKSKDYKYFILTSIVCDKSDIKKIHYRDKIHKEKSDVKVLSKALFESFDRYNKHCHLVSIGNNICHDLNNALNYLIVLAESLDDSSDDNIKQIYNQITQSISRIQDDSTFDSFVFGNEYDANSQLQNFRIFSEELEQYYKVAETKLKNIDPDSDQNKYCVYAGISLLRTLLRRNLMMLGDDFNFFGVKKAFSLHKMVKKIILLLKYKASNKDVRFPHFIGSPQHRVVGQSDDVFTAIFTLIDNAIKYSCPNDDVFITFDENDGSLSLSIANSSNYLSSYDIEHIHDKFYRGSNKSTKGQGLGLYMVKLICENNNIEYCASYEKGKFIYKLIFRKVVE